MTICVQVMCPFGDGNVAARTFGRARRHRPYHSNTCKQAASTETQKTMLAVTLQTMYSRKQGFDGALQAMYSRKQGFDGALQAMYSRKQGFDGALQAMYSRKQGFDDALQAMYSCKQGFDGAEHECCGEKGYRGVGDATVTPKE